jgi:hypothetical protein
MADGRENNAHAFVYVLEGWARRASAASDSTNGAAARGQQPDPPSEARPGDLTRWLGPEQLRLRLEYRRNEYTGDYGREAEMWLFEKAAEAAAIERKRFQIIRLWSIIGGVAAVVAAITGLITAWPVIKEWIR